MVELLETLRNARNDVIDVRETAVADGLDEVAVAKLTIAMRLLTEAANRLNAEERRLVRA